MAQLDLFTVKVFQVSKEDIANGGEHKLEVIDDNRATSGLRYLEEHPNMISASVIKGRMIELEHSKLAGPSVKFKTIISFDRSLEPGQSLGVALIPQDGYISKPDNDLTTPSS